MRCVLDSNVALKVTLPEMDSAKSTQLLLEFQSGLHQLIAPDVSAVELAMRLLGRMPELLKPSEASHKLARLLAIRPELFPSLAL